jgi:drug/metabolite transporter (DMT)-like permease
VNPRPLDAAACAIMVVLCASWGLNQVAIKLTLTGFPPFTQGVLRSVAALPLVFLIARLRGVRILERDGTLVMGIAVGVLFGVEFGFIFRGLVLTTASRGVIFVYTAPLFIALGARLFLHERLSPLQWAGLGLAFAGIVVAMGVPDPSVSAATLVGDGLMIIGGALWSATTLVIKGSVLAKIPTEKTTFYQLAVSAFVFVIAAIVFGERMDTTPSAAAIGWLAYQAIWVVAITFTIWFGLVVRYSASRLSAFSFLTPLFGVAAGHLIMGDPMTPTFAVAVALVIGGLVLVNR